MMCGKISCGFSILIIAVTLVCYTNVVKAQVVKEGLVSHWTFDQADIEGTTVKDVQGGNDGSIEGGPKTVEGRTGDALSFDGAADHIVVPSDDSMNFGAGDFTVCAWAKTTAVTGRWAQRQDIVGKGDPSVSGYALSADSNKAFFWIGGAGEVPGTSEINDGNWHYLAGVRKSSEVFLYVDGNLEANGTNAENVDTTLSCVIAKHPTKGESYFAGDIDEACIYSRALNEEEIGENFELKVAVSRRPDEKLSFTWGRVKALANQ
jgi:hypothetical protein